MEHITRHQNLPLPSNPSAVEDHERPSGSYEYDAFLSYRRRDATPLARWIRDKLQRFRLPSEILCELKPEKQELHSRRPQIWLDTSYEKSSDDFLLRKIFPALDKSARLIVVCTPAALENIYGKDGSAQSNWLVREVDHFLGKTLADEMNRPIDVVFGPGAIEGQYPGRLSERLRWDWIDLRSFNAWRVRTFTETLDDGLAKLVASLYDVPDRFLPVLRHEERRQRHRKIIGFAVVTFFVAALTTALAIYGFIERGDAVSALRSVLVARAQMSVRLATEELQKQDPDQALATALAGVETPSMADTDRAVITDSITAIANSIANETFGGILHDHSDAVLRVSLGPDARSALTVGADEKAVLWGGENGYALRPVRSTILAGSAFAIAKNKGLVASGSASGQIRFWNSSMPESSPTPFNFGESIGVLAFSDDGQLIAALGTAGKLAVWDVVRNVLLWAAPIPVPDASTIAFSPNCSCLAVGTTTGDLLAWSVGRKDTILVRGASGRITRGAFGREGQFLFSTDDGRLWLTSAPLWPTPLTIGQHDGSITAVVVSSDGKLAATTGLDGIAWIWDLTKRVAWKRIKASAGATLSDVAFSPDSGSIALAYGGGTVGIWDLGDARTDPSEALVMHGHAGTVLDLSFSSDGNWLASASLDRTVRLWRTQTAHRPRMLQAHQAAAIHAASRSGHYLISGGITDKKVQIWTGPNWEYGTSISLESPPSALAISDDGKTAFIGTDKGDILQWDTSGSVTTTFSHDNGRVQSVAISPGENALAAIGVDGKLIICVINPAPPQCEPVPLGGWGYSVAFSEDGHWVGATSGVEGVKGLALVRDLNSGKIKQLTGHTERVSTIGFDRPGNRAITVSWDGTARIWDVSSGKELVRLVEPKGRMSTAGFSPDGKWVATSSNDKTLRLWKIPKPTELSPTVILESDDSILISDKDALAQIQFGLGGNILAGSLVNGDIHLWHVPDGTLRVVLEGDGSSISDMRFQPDGLHITATTQSGRLLSWSVPPALGLSDELLLSAARSMLPLPGSLTGKLKEPSTTRSLTLKACSFLHEHNVGLPPQNLSGSARARQQVNVPASCNSNLTGEAPRLLRGALIAEAEGDLVTALQNFTAASSQGESSAEIGLGDLSFIDSLGGADAANALGHYTRARDEGDPHAASRLGWLLLLDETMERVAQAKSYFEEGSREGDADGFAGLAWVNERYGSSPQDLEAAFSNYTEAQYAYERDGDLAFAQEVGERRAALARLMAPEQVAERFISIRAAIASSNAGKRQ